MIKPYKSKFEEKEAKYDFEKEGNDIETLIENYKDLIIDLLERIEDQSKLFAKNKENKNKIKIQTRKILNLLNKEYFPELYDLISIDEED